MLDYEGTLSLPAHTLRSGGALRKTKGEPLSGNRLEHARNLIPLIGVFGGNSSSTMIKGRAQIGKVVPRVKETEHIMSRPSKLPLLSQFELLGIERYSRFDDSDTADFPSTAAAESDAESPATGSHLMRYEVETLPAGTTFESWIRLTRATDLQIAFFTDVLAEFTAAGRLGGRLSIGHGMVRVESTRSTTAGTTASAVDWREHLRSVRDDALEVLANW
ncbi:hypothetical protein GCM10020255_017060 [Rhodococcus baikonurensis]